MARTIQSVERAFQILECLAHERASCGVRELARKSGLTPATTLALLKTMLGPGYVSYDPDHRRYGIGAGLRRLLRNVDEADQIAALITPDLDRLHRSCGETTLAVGFDGKALKILYHRHSTHPLSVHHSAPSTILHRLATTQALVSVQPEKIQQRLIDSLGMTLSERREFQKRLQAARKAGHAEVVNSRNSGIAALALPVVEPTGSCRLAVGLSVPVHRFTPEKRQELHRSLERTVDDIRKLIDPRN